MNKFGTDHFFKSFMCVYPKVYTLNTYMHGSANSNIFETLLKSVTSPCDETNKPLLP